MNRLKVEETKDVSKAEIQTEREVQRGLSIENNLSQSWEDLSLVSSSLCHFAETITCRDDTQLMIRRARLVITYMVRNAYEVYTITKNNLQNS